MPILREVLPGLLFTFLAALMLIPVLIRKIKLPRRLQFENVGPEALTPAQAQFLSARDAELAPLGLEPFATYRVTNLSGRNLLRTYFSAVEPTRCSVTVLSMGRSVSQQINIEFITHFADGTILTTRNLELSSVFKPMPKCVYQECRGLKDLAELKRRHDERSAAMRDRQPTFLDRSRFFQLFQQYHERWCEYERSEGLLRFDAESDLYRGTLGVALRGIGNFFNPLADNFTPWRLAAGLLLGAGVPVLVLRYPVQVMRWLSPLFGLAAANFGAVLIGAYVIAGIAVGLIFRQKIFIWGYVLGVVAALAAPGNTGRGMYVMSLIMAWAAEITFRTRARAQKLI
jgi:hypothetical protein